MIRTLQRLGVVAVLLLVVAALTGCGTAEEELATAYQQGYEDGAAAAEENAEAAGEDAEPNPADCSDCYALGWDEGYAQGYADGVAAD
ncbi:MAG: hypothetical protein ACOC9B_02645 [Chloroflexota bacterium]